MWESSIEKLWVNAIVMKVKKVKKTFARKSIKEIDKVNVLYQNGSQFLALPMGFSIIKMQSKSLV